LEKIHGKTKQLKTEGSINMANTKKSIIPKILFYALILALFAFLLWHRLYLAVGIILLVVLVLFYGLGQLMYSMMFTKKATGRGVLLPDEDIIAGEIGASGKEIKFDFVSKLFNAEGGLKAMFNLPNFTPFQEGVKWFTSKNPQKLSINSPAATKDKGQIHADIIKAEQPSNIWVICAHGVSAAPRNLASVARDFHEAGYNLLFHHMRAHGYSEAKGVSLGWLDRFEIIEWINYLIREYDNPQIVLYGVSLGGASVMMTTGEDLPPNVKCAIEDSGFSTAEKMIKYQLKKIFGLPAIFAHSFGASVRLSQGFSIKKASCITQLQKSKTPTLFIHCSKDEAAPPYMLDENYDAAACEKEKLMFEGLGHGEGKYAQPEPFFCNVMGFIEKHLD